MRPIDADTIPYTMLYKENWLKGTGVEKPGVWKDTIDAMPTIEQPEIIRCKDCQYWESGTRYGKCKLTYISVTGDYYCAAAAERRDE